MAHTKAAGAAKRTVNVIGKRLGMKKYTGEFVRPGNIILRQRGTRFHPGVGTMIGKDHTIFAVVEGLVSFKRMTGFKRAKKMILVTPIDAKPVAKKVKPKAKTTPAKVTKSETKAKSTTTAKKKATTKAK